MRLLIKGNEPDLFNARRRGSEGLDGDVRCLFCREPESGRITQIYAMANPGS
ncbi:hypothetical protein [Streptomyces sp. 2A115]|uniref:hypothetical protein n=1 Tax=Streptomyces sp. 2A115 TaxID=3457439 RepID=UPI003FD450AD